MTSLKWSTYICSAIALSGCGAITPEMRHSSAAIGATGGSPEGEFRASVAYNIACELSVGILRSMKLPQASNSLDWLQHYGAIVTLKIVAEDQSSFSPNSTLLGPLFSSPSFSLGLGGALSANGTRTETLQFTFPDGQLYQDAIKNQKVGNVDCSHREKSFMIESNLKIDDFVFDNAYVATTLIDSAQKVSKSPLSQMQYETNFVSSYNGNITPTWKFTKATVNSSGTFLSATRTDTSDITITIGKLDADTKALHNTALIGNAAGLSAQSLVH